MANTGAMIALYPPAEVAASLSQAAARVTSAPESADALHCTLVYLGEAAVIEAQKQSLIDAVREYAAGYAPITADINGIGRFFNGEDKHAVFANVDAPTLPDFRQTLVALVQSSGIQPVLNHGFTPHVTLAYVDPTEATPGMAIQPIPVTFDAVVIAWGDESFSFPLGGVVIGTETPTPDVQKGSFVVTKQANGLYRWTATSSNNVRDRHRETVSRAALELDVYRTKTFGDDSFLYLYHIPFPLGGAPDFRAVVDGFLIESGEFYPTNVATAVAKYIQKYPGAPDGSGWGVSIGFKGNPDLDGTYEVIRTKERSVLPLSRAANSITAFQLMEVNLMPLNNEQLKFLETMASDPEARDAAKAIFDAVDKSKQVDQAGLQRKGNRFSQLFNGPGRYEAKPADTVTKDAGGAAKAAQEAVAAVETAQAAVQDAAAAVADVAAETTGAGATDPAAVDPNAAAATNTNAVAPVDTAKPSGLTDADLAQLGKYIDERIAAAMSGMQNNVQKMIGDVDKLLKTVSDEATVKAHNELGSLSLADRLKAISASRSDKTIINATDELVTKNGLPEAPAEDRTVKGRFGFVPAKTGN